MNAYAVDKAPFEKFYAGNSASLPLWAQLRLTQKAKAICALPDPLASGGKSPLTGKWHYPVSKFHIVAEVDDAARVVRLLYFLSLS